MSASLAPCPSCHRHVMVIEPACPFCRAALVDLAPASFDPRAAPRRVAHMALAVGASLALGACPSPSSPAGVYGAAPPPVFPRGDASAPRTTADAALPRRTVDDPGGGAEIYGAPPPPATRPDAAPPGPANGPGGAAPR